LNRAIDILPESGKPLHLKVFGNCGFKGYYDAYRKLFYTELGEFPGKPAYYGPLVIEWVYVKATSKQ
jgi:hypothetical protein